MKKIAFLILITLFLPHFYSQTSPVSGLKEAESGFSILRNSADTLTPNALKVVDANPLQATLNRAQSQSLSLSTACYSLSDQSLALSLQNAFISNSLLFGDCNNLEIAIYTPISQTLRLAESASLPLISIQAQAPVQKVSHSFGYSLSLWSHMKNSSETWSNSFLPLILKEPLVKINNSTNHSSLHLYSLTLAQLRVRIC